MTTCPTPPRPRRTTVRSVLVGAGILAATFGLTACTGETDTSTVISDGSVVSSTSTTVDGGSDTPQVNVVGTPAPFTISPFTIQNGG